MKAKSIPYLELEKIEDLLERLYDHTFENKCIWEKENLDFNNWSCKNIAKDYYYEVIKYDSLPYYFFNIKRKSDGSKVIDFETSEDDTNTILKRLYFLIREINLNENKILDDLYEEMLST